MRGDGFLFGDVHPKGLFGQQAVRTGDSVFDNSGYVESARADAAGQRYIPFQEPEVDINGNRMLFAGRVLHDENGRSYDACLRIFFQDCRDQRLNA